MAARFPVFGIDSSGDPRTRRRAAGDPRGRARGEISPVELAPIDENLSGGSARTEALANAEGFMAAFAVERAEVADADGPARDELSDVAEFYARAKDATQREVVARLKAYAAALAPALRPKYQATLQFLDAKGGRYAAFAKDLGLKK